MLQTARRWGDGQWRAEPGRRAIAGRHRRGDRTQSGKTGAVDAQRKRRGAAVVGERCRVVEKLLAVALDRGGVAEHLDEITARRRTLDRAGDVDGRDGFTD